METNRPPPPVREDPAAFDQKMGTKAQMNCLWRSFTRCIRRKRGLGRQIRTPKSVISVMFRYQFLRIPSTSDQFQSESGCTEPTVWLRLGFLSERWTERKWHYNAEKVMEQLADCCSVWTLGHKSYGRKHTTIQSIGARIVLIGEHLYWQTQQIDDICDGCTRESARLESGDNQLAKVSEKSRSERVTDVLY